MVSIKGVEDTGLGVEFALGFPNREVAMSFNDFVAGSLTGISNTLPDRKLLYASLQQGDIEQFHKALLSLFAGINYNNDTNNKISIYEGYYASIVYTYLASLGLDLTAEDATSVGRIDLTIKVGKRIYIIEFKVDDAGKALQQIKEKNYHQKYHNAGNDIYLIGINFDSAKRNISEFEWEMG